MHAASDSEKFTAASALCRISMHSPNVLQFVSDRAGFDKFQNGLFSGTLKTQQAFVTIFVTLLSNPVHAKRILLDQNLLKKLIRNLESSSLILRGKIYLLIAEVSIRSHDALLTCCELRMITHIERDSKKVFMGGKDNKELLEYVHQCLTVVVNNVVGVFPPIFDGMCFLKPCLHVQNMVNKLSAHSFQTVSNFMQ